MLTQVFRFFAIIFFAQLACGAQELSASNEKSAEVSGMLEGAGSLSIVAQSSESMPIQVITVQSDEHTQYDAPFIEHLKKLLEFSGHCSVTLSPGTFPKTRDEIKIQRERGYPLVMYLSADREAGYSWRLYDTATGQMLGGKKYIQDHSALSKRSLAYRVAEDMYQLLQGKPGSFCSRIAYVRTKADPVTRAVTSVLCTAAIDGGDMREEDYSPHVLVSPTFHPSVTQQALFYSEFTPTNVRIRVTDCAGGIRTVIDRDGTHAGVSLSPKRSEVVYCSSGQIWCCRYDARTRRAEQVMLVDRIDGEPCASPNLLPDGTIVFCAGGSLYTFDPREGSVDTLTKNCYAISPTYSLESHALAYSRRVQGIFQIFWYDYATKNHKQVTTGRHNVTDPVVSPCGNYILYVREEGAASRIVVEHRKTHARNLLTPVATRCAYPAWSPFYTE